MQNDRREFIKKALYGIFAALGGAYILSWLTILGPRKEERKQLLFVPLLPEDDVPRRGVRKTELVYRVAGSEHRMRVFIVSADDSFIVLSAVCSHLGCLVNYNKPKQEFLCPCHGGRYDLTGKNIAGPPPRPLTRFPVKVVQGTVLVGVRV
jgi:Rieske Fe-S protein